MTKLQAGKSVSLKENPLSQLPSKHETLIRCWFNEHWPIVFDVGLTLNQHRIYVSCLLGGIRL